MRTAEFDAERLEARAGDGWTTLTELADTLVRDHGVPFGTAHDITSALVAASQREPDRPLSALLEEASEASLGQPVTYSDSELAEILSPRHFVEMRRTFGGPAPQETTRAAEASRAQLKADQEWVNKTVGALERAERLLVQRVAEL